MKWVVVAIASFVFLTSSYAKADEMYSWEDADGVHFVDSIASVPPKYRKRAQKRAGISAQESSTAQTDTQQQPANNPPAASNAPSSQSKEESKAVVAALRKMAAHCHTGITYKNYGVAMGDLQYAINTFNDSQESKDNPRLTSVVNEAFQHYSFAGYVWDLKFSGRGVTRRIDRYSSLGEQILKYPGAAEWDSGGGVLVRGDDGLSVISIGLAISKIFSTANSIANSSASYL